MRADPSPPRYAPPPRIFGAPLSHAVVVSAMPATSRRVLHPAFEEDEMLLILVGGVLGLCAGAVQMIWTT